jgi:Protein of unknown function (DUF3311)
MGWLGLFDIRTLACCYRSSDVRFERLVGQPSLIGKVRVARHPLTGNPATIPQIVCGRMRMKRPSLGAILLGLIPFAATCFSVALWDRVYPRILGLPFNFFWLILWLLLTPLLMWGAYRLEEPRARAARRENGGAD